MSEHVKFTEQSNVLDTIAPMMPLYDATSTFWTAVREDDYNISTII